MIVVMVGVGVVDGVIDPEVMPQVEEGVHVGDEGVSVSHRLAMAPPRARPVI